MVGAIKKRILHFDWEVSIEELWREKIRWDCYKQFNSFFIAQKPLVDQDLLFIEVSQSHSDTPQPVGFLWTRDWPVAENFT
jgi:hypothetical protein